MRTLAALTLFGVSFGLVEASIVVYLRTLCEPLQARFRPSAPRDDLFPLFTEEQLRHAGEPYTRLIKTELAREFGTLLMLIAVGLAVSREPGLWTAASLVAFGFWDIFYYVFLKVLIDWPASLFTWDLLFLLPVPWAGPVVTPVIVSLAMVACGGHYLFRPRPMDAISWITALAGGLIQVVAFCWDWRNLIAGGMPNPFPWWLFGIGAAIGVGGYIRTALRKESA